MEGTAEMYSERCGLSPGQGMAPSKVVTNASWGQELESVMGTLPGWSIALTHRVPIYGRHAGLWWPAPFVELLPFPQSSQTLPMDTEQNAQDFQSPGPDSHCLFNFHG